MMTEAERILRSMEDHHDFSLLKEMNGQRCALRQSAHLKRAADADYGHKSDISHGRRDRITRASRISHLGFQRAAYKGQSEKATKPPEVVDHPSYRRVDIGAVAISSGNLSRREVQQLKRKAREEIMAYQEEQRFRDGINQGR